MSRDVFQARDVIHGFAVCHVNNVCDDRYTRNETEPAQAGREEEGERSPVPGRQSKKAGTGENRENANITQRARRVAPLCPS